MFKNAKVVRLIPDNTGRGGSKTAVTSQSANIDTNLVGGFFVFMGRWRTASIPVSNQNYLTPTQLGLTFSGGTTHALNSFSVYGTNAAQPPTNYVLSHSEDAGETHYILNHTGAGSPGIIASGVSAPNSFTPAVFENIRSRCFICWAGTPTTIDPDSVDSPARTANNIIFDPNNTNAKIYDLGIEGPSTAPTYTLGGSSTGTCCVTNGSNQVNSAVATANWSASTKSITIKGVNYRVQSPGGDVTTFNSSTSCSGTGGTKTLTLNNFLLPANGDYNGLTIHITDGGSSEDVVIASYVLAPPNTTVTTVANLAFGHAAKAWAVTGEALILEAAYAGASDSAASYTAYSGALSWGDVGPQYAYAYYDRITGHISNVSPILQITEKNVGGVDITLSNLVQTALADAYRFDQIVVFRTLTSQGGISGGVGYPMVGTPPLVFDGPSNTGVGPPLTFVDTHPDSDLIQTSTLQWPLTTNRKPPILAHFAYWDGRLWANPTDDVTAIRFSCDSIQAPFGIAEECFPNYNLLRIPAQDGRVTGMCLVGSYMVITTQRYAYYVAGNNELNYRLLRFATTTFGVEQYQMAEFAGDTDQNSAALAYLGGDSKVYLLAPGYGNISLSEPIQDILVAALQNNQTNFSRAKVQPVAVGGQKLLLVQLPITDGFTRFLVYDFDHKIWSSFFFSTQSFTAFTTVYQALSTDFNYRVPADFLMAHEGFIYSWLLPPDQAHRPDIPPFGPFLEISPLDFGRKSQKQLNFVRIYCNGATRQNPDQVDDPNNWTIQIVTDETSLPSAGTKYVPTMNPDILRQLQPDGGRPFDDPLARELIVMLPNDATNNLQGFRFSFRINSPTAEYPIEGNGHQYAYDCYAIDICFTDLVPEDEATP